MSNLQHHRAASRLEHVAQHMSSCHSLPLKTPSQSTARHAVFSFVWPPSKDTTAHSAEGEFDRADDARGRKRLSRHWVVAVATEVAEPVTVISPASVPKSCLFVARRENYSLCTDTTAMP